MVPVVEGGFDIMTVALLQIVTSQPNENYDCTL